MEQKIAMNHIEALSEAQRRWGLNNSWVKKPEDTDSGLFEVAKGTHGYYLQGSGASWEEAFAVADAVAQVRLKNKHAYAAFVVTGDHGDKASAVIRVETSNSGRRHKPRDLSEKFVYEGEALSAAQHEAAQKAWINAASKVTT